jgi:hypothetical protein
MRSITGVPPLIVGALLVLQAPIQAQTDGSPLPVSLSGFAQAGKSRRPFSNSAPTSVPGRAEVRRDYLSAAN